MTAREKIEGLTNAWYGFALFSALIMLVSNGIGIFSLIGLVMGTSFSLFVTWFLGRRLLNRSGFWRFLLVIASVLGAMFMGLGLFKQIWSLFGGFSFSTLLTTAVTAGSLWMNIRSYTTLTDSSVKTYCA